jgi:hypothetical protein
MTPEIPNPDLTEGDIPPLGADLQAMWKFARTFDGYEYIKAHPPLDPPSSGNLVNWLARLANSALAAYHRDGSLPKTLSELRSCLFFESRRCHHQGSARSGYDEAAGSPYIHALVEAIRRKVRVRERD